MPPVSRLGDQNSGHTPFAPVPLIQGSSNVLTNNMPTSRLGDTLLVHCFPYAGCHTDTVTMGSKTVLVNNLPVARIGDPTGPATLVQGSSNVMAGG